MNVHHVPNLMAWRSWHGDLNYHVKYIHNHYEVRIMRQNGAYDGDWSLDGLKSDFTPSKPPL